MQHCCHMTSSSSLTHPVIFWEIISYFAFWIVLCKTWLNSDNVSRKSQQLINSFHYCFWTLMYILGQASPTSPKKTWSKRQKQSSETFMWLFSNMWRLPRDPACAAGVPCDSPSSRSIRTLQNRPVWLLLQLWCTSGSTPVWRHFRTAGRPSGAQKCTNSGHF